MGVWARACVRAVCVCVCVGALRARVRVCAWCVCPHLLVEAEGVERPADLAHVPRYIYTHIYTIWRTCRDTFTPIFTQYGARAAIHLHPHLHPYLHPHNDTFTPIFAAIHLHPYLHNMPLHLHICIMSAHAHDCHIQIIRAIVACEPSTVYGRAVAMVMAATIN